MRFPKIRKDICKKCSHKCEDYLNNKINHEDAVTSCPLKIWNEILIEGIVPTNPIIKNLISFNIATWKELHERALEFEGKDDSEWLFNDFNKRIKFSGCDCRRDWAHYLTINSPTWDNYFSWSWKAHNHVNRKLSKPIISLEEAYKLYKVIV